MILLDQIREISVGDEETVATSFTGWLDDGETLDGVSSAVCTRVKGEGSVGDLNINNLRTNALAYVEADTLETIAANEAALFDVSGQQANTIYYVAIQVTTTGNRRKNCELRLEVG